MCRPTVTMAVTLGSPASLRRPPVVPLRLVLSDPAKSTKQSCFTESRLLSYKKDEDISIATLLVRYAESYHYNLIVSTVISSTDNSNGENAMTSARFFVQYSCTHTSTFLTLVVCFQSLICRFNLQFGDSMDVNISIGILIKSKRSQKVGIKLAKNHIPSTTPSRHLQ